VPDGNSEFDMDIAQQWFAPIAGVLVSLAERHYGLVDRYYHDSPSWTFVSIIRAVAKRPLASVAMLARSRRIIRPDTWTITIALHGSFTGASRAKFQKMQML
jgi:hypothetical protein